MVGLALVYYQQRDLKNAKELIIEAIKLQPNYINGLLNLAIIYNKLGNYVKARDILVKLIKKEPQLAVAYFQLSGVQMNLRENEKALMNLQKAADLGHEKAMLLLKGINKSKKQVSI